MGDSRDFVTGWLANATALVIDDSKIARQVLVAELREIGVRTVRECATLNDARIRLDNTAFDLVLCDYHFADSQATGQDFLEEIRENSLLPLSSVFVMVTGEASYKCVVETVETAPDDYLLKPFTAESLHQRIEEILHRKRAFAPVYDALARGDEAEALEKVEVLASKRGRNRVIAAKLAAELCVKLQRVDHARKHYETVLNAKAIPWAKMGIAKLAYEDDDRPQARRTLESLLAARPTFVDAYDLLGRMLLENGELEEALEVLRRAVSITPASITRLQRYGSLAFTLGHRDDAAAALSKAARLGGHSRSLDFQTFVQLALLALDAGNGRELSSLRLQIARARENAPESFRLSCFQLLVDAAADLLEKRLAAAVGAIEQVARRALDEKFDFELASNFLGLLSRFHERECHHHAEDEWVETIAQRFCISKTAARYLLTHAHARFEPIVAEAQAEVSRQCNEAMFRVMRGNVVEGVTQLLDLGRRTLNARALALVESVGNRHTDDPRLPPLVEEARVLRQRYCTQGTHAAVGVDTSTLAPRPPPSPESPALAA
jgi:CheY-like chemotaxis protein